MFSKRLERLERPRQSVSEGGGWNGWNSKTFGFTLIEILVASFIFVVAVLASFSAFYSTTSYQAKTKVVRETTQEARNVIETLTREIRLADGVEVLNLDGTSCSNNCPVLKITKDGVDKKYKYNSDNNNNKIILDTTLPADVTTNNVNVSNLSFTKTSDGGIQIQLTIKEKQQYVKMAEKGVITLKTTVYKRGYK